MAESAHLADPHVLIGLVAADGGPVTWPLLTSLQLAKEYALTGDRIPAERAAADRPGQPRRAPTTRCSTRRWPAPRRSPSCPRRRPRTPSGSSTCTSSGPCWPRSTSPSRAEDRSFTSPELRANLDRLLAKDMRGHRVDFELDRRADRAAARSLREVVERECPPSLVRAVVEDDDDGDALWKTLVDLEWPGLTVPEERRRQRGHRGRAGAWSSRSSGWAADPTPFLATTTQHVPLVREALQRRRCGPSALAAIAGGQPRRRACSPPTRSRRRPDGDGWVLPGTRPHVLDGDRADELAVVAHDRRRARRRSSCPAPTSPRPASRRSTAASTSPTVHARRRARRRPSEPSSARRSAAAVERAREEAVTGLAATMVGAVAADLRPRPRPHHGTATSSACRSARSRR